MRIIAIALVWLALALPCHAQMTTLGAGGTKASATYQGPGDIASYNVFYSLRAYSKATRGNAVANLCNSTGGVDVTCADATSDPATGALVIPGSLNSFCPGSVCTVKILYDQTNSNSCLGSTSCNLTQATVANRPVLTASAIGSLSAMKFTAASSMQLTSSAHAPTIAQPLTFTSVAERTGATASNTGLYEDTAQTGMLWDNAVNTVSSYAGGSFQFNATAADNSPHAFQLVLNAASSTYNVDGTTTNANSGNNPGTAGWGSANIVIGNSAGGFSTMFFEEGGTISGSQSSLLQGQVCHNQITYYGISGSC